MKLVYRVYNDLSGKHVVDIYYDGDKYSIKLLKTVDIPIFASTFDVDTGKFIEGARPNPESRFIENWLADRVIPPNRDMIKDTLAANGIYEYDWRELIKYNHGRTTDDYFSVEVVE